MSDPLGTRVPDVFLHCDRCSREWILGLPLDPNHAYYRIAKRTGKYLCPDCLNAIKKRKVEKTWEPGE